MPQQVRGVVARAKGAPVEVETIIIPDPGPGEVVVRVQACGVCHTDLHYREGGINDEFPFLLGHEAAGVVEAVGAGVTDVAPGDFVILNWRAVVRYSAGPAAAVSPGTASTRTTPTQKMTLERRHRAVSRARHRRVRREDPRPRRAVHEGRTRRLPPAVAGLLGLRGDGRPRCGDQHRRGRARRLGRGHRLRRRRRRGDRGRPPGRARRRSSRSTPTTSKLDWAREFGATHTVNARERDTVEAVQELTDGFGADVVIDAVGRPETYKQAFYARDLAGTVVLVGVPTPDMQIELPLIDVFGRGGATEVVLVRRLPALRGTSPCSSTCICRAACRWSKFVSETIGSTTSRPRSTRCTTARCCVRSWSADDCQSVRRVDQRRHLGHVQPRRRHLGRRQQRLAGRRRRRGRRDRRRARRGSDRRGRRGTQRRGDRRAPTATTTTSPWRPSWPHTPRRAGPAASRRRRAVEDDPPRATALDVECRAA